MYQVRRNIWFLVILCFPAMFVVTVFSLYPLLNGVYMSFTDTTPLRQTVNFVGFENYTLLFSDRVFWQVLGNTIFINGVSIIIAVILATALALLLNGGIRYSGLYRSLIFQVWVVPWIAIAILWGWLFNTDYGVVNGTLLELGLVDEGVEWLFNPIAGQWAIILAFAWRSTPFLMVIILAALQSVPEEVLDAAEVDGANYFQKTYRVTLPFIRNIILSAALLQTVRLFQEMTLPFVLTQGGPMNSTMVLSMFSYKLAFEAWDFALAATVGVVWLIMLLTFGSIYLKGLVREH